MSLSKYISCVCTNKELISPKHLMNKEHNKIVILEEIINVRTNEELKEFKLGSSLKSNFLISRYSSNIKPVKQKLFE